MYEQVSHSLLNRILDQLKPEIRKKDLRHFYTRLGANFYAIYSLFHVLYGKRDDFEQQLQRLGWRSTRTPLPVTSRGWESVWVICRNWV